MTLPYATPKYSSRIYQTDITDNQVFLNFRYIEPSKNLKRSIMPSELQIAKNILKGIEGKGFKKIGKTRCKKEDQTKQFLIMPFRNQNKCLDMAH